MLRFRRRVADQFCRLKFSRDRFQPIEIHEHKNTRMFGRAIRTRGAVKTEVSAEQRLLLPLDQFAFSELTSERKQQHLRLVFGTHEVTMRGYSLRASRPQ